MINLDPPVGKWVGGVTLCSRSGLNSFDIKLYKIVVLSILLA